jgi:tripartite-type tricarboxylate transporter receptor subunit TctC
MIARRSVLAAGLAAAVPARAQGWSPDRPIRLVVPFPPGGPTDLVARPLAQRLGEALGQTVLVENRGGAGGNLGAEAVARAAPDGHTLLLSNVGVLAVNAALYRSLPYDPERDFAPVALVAGAPVALVVNTGVPARTVAEFVAWTRAQPGPVPYGSAGVGTPGHLAGEVFRSITGAALAHLPYRGSAPALQDLAAGHLPAMFDPVQSPLGQIEAGRIRALALSAPSRSAALPEVPTMAEAGVPGHEMVAWWAVVAPVRTPRPVLDRLVVEIGRIAEGAAWRDGLGRQGVTAMFRGGADFAAFRRAEAERWAAAVRASGASAE